METSNNTPATVSTPTSDPAAAPVYPAYPAGMPCINPANNNNNNNNINVVLTAPSVAPATQYNYFSPVDPSLQYRSRGIYVLLAFLLGPLGIHEFYFGYKAVGAWMLTIFLMNIIMIFLTLGLFLVPAVFIHLAIMMWIFIRCLIIDAPKGYYKYGDAYIPKGMKP